MAIIKPPKPAPKPHITSVYGQDPYYFTVEELRVMTRNQGLSDKGNKDELIHRFFKNYKGFTIVVK